jgi:hypothetical protein
MSSSNRFQLSMKKFKYSSEITSCKKPYRYRMGTGDGSHGSFQDRGVLPYVQHNGCPLDGDCRVIIRKALPCTLV